VEAFNYNISTTVDTQGIPQWSDPAHKWVCKLYTVFPFDSI
jgi:hypothetical protein